MYRDLVIADSNGRIVANSKSENRDKLKRMNVSSNLGSGKVCKSSLRTIWDWMFVIPIRKTRKPPSFAAVEF